MQKSQGLAGVKLNLNSRKLVDNERSFVDLVDQILRSPGVHGADGKISEPYFSLGMLAVIGQRPITATRILRILLDGEEPMSGKQIAKLLAADLGMEESAFTEGNNFETRVNAILSSLTELGALRDADKDEVASPSPTANYHAIDSSHEGQVSKFVETMESEHGFFSSDLSFTSIADLMIEKYDKRIRFVRTTNEKMPLQPFKSSEIINSLVDPKVGLDLYDAFRVLEDIGPALKPEIATSDIQRLVSQSLRSSRSLKTNPTELKEIADRYLQEFPEQISILLSNGGEQILSHHLAEEFIDEVLSGYKMRADQKDEIARNIFGVLKSFPERKRHESEILPVVRVLIEDRHPIPEGSNISAVGEMLKMAQRAHSMVQILLDADRMKEAHRQSIAMAKFLSKAFLLLLFYLPSSDSRQDVYFSKSLVTHEKDKLSEVFKIPDKKTFDKISTLVEVFQKEPPGSKHMKSLMNEFLKVAQLLGDMLSIDEMDRKAIPKLLVQIQEM